MYLTTADAATSVGVGGVSFCIITDGRRPALLLEELDSIRALGLSTYEIIVAGHLTAGLRSTLGSQPSVRTVSASELAYAGRLGALRNAACVTAQYETLVVADDDMLFHPECAAVLEDVRAGDVVCVRLHNPDGSRYWDWSTFGGPRGHRLLDYDDTDDWTYVTGGLAILSASAWRRVPWDNDRGFYQGEDIEWSARLRAAGFRPRFDPRGRVTHQDARYTQDGHIIRFRQDLSQRERMAPDVDAVGVYRGGTNVPGARWMSDRSTLFAPPATDRQSHLEFRVASTIPALAGEPFHVLVEVNGCELGAARFQGTSICPIAIPLRKSEETMVRLTSEIVVAATHVGLDDERPVSVMLRDVRLTGAGSALEAVPAVS